MGQDLVHGKSRGFLLGSPLTNKQHLRMCVRGKQWASVLVDEKCETVVPSFMWSLSIKATLGVFFYRFFRCVFCP